MMKMNGIRLTVREKGGRERTCFLTEQKGDFRKEQKGDSLTEQSGGAFWSMIPQGESEVFRLETKGLSGCRLDPEHAVSLHIGIDSAERMTAFYMLNDWWTRPAFITSFCEIPERTQLLLIQSENVCRCIVPMTGSVYKTQLMPGTETELHFTMFSGIEETEEIGEPVFVTAEDESAAKAVQKAMKTVAAIKNIPLREERPLPEMLRYLGWCSWDAFYRDVNGEGLVKKAEEFGEKKVPVKWFLIDDGWLSTEGMKLKAFEPDTEKFPEGFLPVIRRIREMCGASYFGVWHAVCGFWEGIADENTLDCEEALYRTAAGGLYPSPFGGEAFYRKWYTILKEQGISFVKVDGQSTVAHFFKENVCVPAAAEGIADAIENALEIMEGNVINCMGMALETVTARKKSGVSRNSDDFVPSRGPAGFKEHLLQNAYNALYHNEIYTCDWDMFWTSQADAPEHALLRAASGGPVYFSDRVGDTDPAVLKPLAYENGELLLPGRSLKPAEDCIFRDPLKEGVLKLHNFGRTGENVTGAMALFNLTEEEQPFFLSAADIPELDPDGEYVVYDWRRGEILQECRGTMQPGEYAWYVFAPKGRHMACFGRADKYCGFTAVTAWREYEDRDVISVREAGPVSWHSENPVKCARMGDEDVTHLIREKDGLYRLEAEVTGKTAEITICWK